MSDLERMRGDTYADEFTIKNKKTKQAIDITGYSFLMTVDSTKEPVDETTQAYQIAGTIIDGPAGRVEFAPSSTQTDRVGNYYYDVQMVDSAGRKRTIIKAKYKFTQDITK